MDLYAEHILDHYRHPRGKRRLPAPSVTHEEMNPACGDRLTVDLALTDGTAEIGWDGDGCAISQAAMSILAEEYSGKSAADLERLTVDDMLKLISVPVGPRRLKCALLALHTVKNALCVAEKKATTPWTERLEK